MAGHQQAIPTRQGQEDWALGSLPPPRPPAPSSLKVDLLEGWPGSRRTKATGSAVAVERLEKQIGTGR